MIRTLLTTVTIGAAVLLAPIAHADTNSDAFIEFLNEEGVPYGTVVHGLTMGYAVCGMMQENPSDDANIVAEAMSNVEGMTLGDAALVTGAAVKAFCPNLAPQLSGAKSELA